MTRDGHEEIYIMNADGTGQTRLTFNQGIFNAVAGWRARVGGSAHVLYGLPISFRR